MIVNQFIGKYKYLSESCWILSVSVRVHTFVSLYMKEHVEVYALMESDYRIKPSFICTIPAGTILRIDQSQIHRLIRIPIITRMIIVSRVTFISLAFQAFHLLINTFLRGFYKSFVHNFICLLHKHWKIVLGHSRGRNSWQNCNVTSS